MVSMQGARIAAAAALTLAAAGAAVGAQAPESETRHCKSGSTSARIGGKHVCLKPGARCKKRLDRAYHRYRFHCHSGRLTQFRAPRGPAKPPTLPEPPNPTGRLIDVGGYRLLLECVGTAPPTVVYEAGATATRFAIRKPQYALRATTRFCSYDRPGTLGSASDARPPGIAPTSETFARELHTVLANANVPGPYLLVGSSFGGLLISTFTARYPQDVAGLVYFDALAPGSAEGYLQLGPLAEPWDGWGDVDRLRALSFGSRPVVVVATQNPGQIPDIRGRATNIVVAEAPQYGHVFLLQVPGLAYEAIRVAVAAVRGGGPLPRCAQTPLARLARRCTP
jgi:pimeloyl-ACP methyl ester carboxylesterase